MEKCDHCGTSFPTDVTECRRCGHPISASDSTLDKIDLTPLRRIAKSVRNPENIVSFLSPRIKFPTQLLLSGQLSLRRYPVVLFEEIIGIDIYLRYLRWRLDDDKAIFDGIHDYKMELLLNDTGLSRDLALHRTREEQSAEDFKSILYSLREQYDGDVTVVDIGANLGYYVLMEATHLGEGTSILAIEPSSENVKTLRSNLVLNGIEDQVKIEKAAIGSEDGSASLKMTAESNLNRIVSNDNIPSESESIEAVPMRSVDAIVKDQGWEASHVDIIRMDVEGYESEVLKGMDDVLNSNSRLLLVIELHCHLLENEILNEIINRLQKSDFAIESAVEAASGLVGSEKRAPISKLEELRGRSRGIRLILSRSDERVNPTQ